MNRAKREKTTRAFSKGYNHGIQGHSRSACPFEDESEPRQCWLNGWREGRQDLWSGFSLGSTFKRVAI